MEFKEFFLSVIAGSYWSSETLAANLTVTLSILGALLLGMMVGFERRYNGRAAGVRTYGMVCMASCAIVVITGQSHVWFGGTLHAAGPIDPTRVIQGITTGVGFLGAGIIHRDRRQTNGLTTAASLWSASAIGILVGVGFYAAAILLSVLCIACMALVSVLEKMLPSKNDLFVKVLFQQGATPSAEDLARIAHKKGYKISEGSLTVVYTKGQPEWCFVVTSIGKGSVPLTDLARDLSAQIGIVSFEIDHVRN